MRTLLLTLLLLTLASCTYKPVQFYPGDIAPTPPGCKSSVDC